MPADGLQVTQADALVIGRRQARSSERVTADPTEAQLFTGCAQLFIERLSAHWSANHSTRDDEIRGSWVGLSLPPFEYIKELRSHGDRPRGFRLGVVLYESDVCVRYSCPSE